MTSIKKKGVMEFPLVDLFLSCFPLYGLSKVVSSTEPPCVPFNFASRLLTPDCKQD
jgi:hypothetical protein